MGQLFDVLKKFEEDFKDSMNDKEKLEKEFKEKLAPAFLYGGYIQVRKEYKIYIRTVEFYFHSETPNGVHDPIVYHRNGRYMKTVPYFPPMTLHAHNSGFDITFEREGKYRASALIRAYEVIDMNNNQFLVWDKGNSQFKSLPKNQFEAKEYGVNKQSTYLYYLLNGFSLGNDNSIKWVDEPRKQRTPITEDIRRNVFESEDEFVYKKIKGKKCDRKWSFTREDNVFTK